MTCFKITSWAIAVFISGIGLSGAALAGSCGHEYCFGAVAAGDNGIAAQAGGYRTATEAYARVAAICADNCSTIEVYHSGCAAIAEGFDRTRHAGFATTRETAQAAALETCQQGDPRACRIRVLACSQ